MNKFAFLYHPFDLDALVSRRGIQEESMAGMNKRSVERTLRWLPPTRRASTVVTSSQGNSVLGEMIIVPLIC